MGKVKTINGQCALCRQNKELQLSHIVPHFVGRKMIKTAPENIRITNEPNKVAQDIEKHYMLCRMNSHDYRYEDKSGFCYLDSYFGGECFSGEEVVWLHDIPVWSLFSVTLLKRCDRGRILAVFVFLPN